MKSWEEFFANVTYKPGFTFEIREALESVKKEN